MSPPLDTETAIILGEIRGQLRELIHNGNNNSQKLDALGMRVAALETERNRRDGMASVIQTILKSPIVGWFVGLGISAWAVLTGKVHI